MSEPGAHLEPTGEQRGRRRRWLVLAGGTLAQTTWSAVPVAVVILSPAIRRQFGLSLGEVGVLLASAQGGGAATALPWGHLADHIGERLVMTIGLAISTVSLGAAAAASSFVPLLVALVACGAAGSSVSAASGRAIMGWFAASHRGLVLAIRQSAVPLGGFIAALTISTAHVTQGFELLAALSAVGAIAAAALVHEPADDQRIRPPSLFAVLRNPPLQRLALGSAILSSAQVCITGFAAVLLVEVAGVSSAATAAAFAVMQAASMVLRIGVGRWSDVRRQRVRPMFEIAVMLALMSVAVAALTGADATLLVPLIVVVGAASMAWNGLSFTATAELAGRHASGTALGIQQTALGVWAFIAAPLFGTLVSASSWQTGFVVLAAVTAVSAVVLRPLVEERDRDPQGAPRV